jgi:predicted  nucleic acid-binding Zn-ribbon protein
MGAKLQALRNLQDIELQLADIRRQLRRKQVMVSAQAAKLNSTQQALEAERDEIRRTQASVDELDLDIKGRTGKINRLREHLNTVRTNREYAAVLSELNNEKADVSRLESRALQMMERIEARTKTLREQQERERRETERLDQLNAQFEQANQSFAERRARLEQQRAEAAREFAPEVLELFERVSERYEGEVMAKVVRTRPGRDEFVCDGCYMSLAAERANALKIRDDVLTCPNCGRVLFLEE